MTRRGAALALLLLAAAAFSLTSSVAADDHEEDASVECVVAGATVVDCDDEGIADEHGVNCDVPHYHGDLNGVSDPDEYGCGHGEVTKQPISSESEDESGGVLDTLYTWFDVVVQGVTGGFSPKTVQESVEIVEESSEGIAENAENAEEYFEAYPDAPDRDRYTLEDENPEENAPVPSLYRWFWSFFE